MGARAAGQPRQPGRQRATQRVSRAAAALVSARAEATRGRRLEGTALAPERERSERGRPGKAVRPARRVRPRAHIRLVFQILRVSMLVRVQKKLYRFAVAGSQHASAYASPHIAIIGVTGDSARRRHTRES